MRRRKEGGVRVGEKNREEVNREEEGGEGRREE